MFLWGSASMPKYGHGSTHNNQLFDWINNYFDYCLLVCPNDVTSNDTLVNRKPMALTLVVGVSAYMIFYIDAYWCHNYYFLSSRYNHNTSLMPGSHQTFRAGKTGLPGRKTSHSGPEIWKPVWTGEFGSRSAAPGRPANRYFPGRQKVEIISTSFGRNTSFCNMRTWCEEEVCPFCQHFTRNLADMESLTKTNILFHATLKIKQEILPSLSLKRDQFG